MARPTPDERYWFLVVMTRRETMFWFLQPWHLWIIGLVMLLSYMMARHLAKPVRTLRYAVDRFGRGDFTARAPVGGSDEVARLSTTFNQMGDRIETLVMAQRRLLQDISHELRSPLARLNVAIELARSAPDPEPSLDRIQKEADRLNELVGELIEVTRAEGDPSRRRTEIIRLDEVVTQVVEDSEIEANALVRNAIRHAPPSTGVEVRVAEDKDGAHIRVRDYGSGVPAEALPMLFEPFYRVESDRGRSSGGVGLGLAIARRAVELHRGTVRATNADPGLAVEIVIPGAPKTPAAPQTDAHPVGA
jgi:two-component system sensor histidine kinase CpxA